MSKREDIMKKDSDTPLITGGILYENGNIESFDEIEGKKEERKKVSGKKDFGDIQTDRLKATAHRFENITGLVSPPYEMLNLTRLPLINTFHNKCINIKATDVVGKGYRIELVNGMAKNDAQENMLKDFLKDAPEKGRTFGQIVNNWIVDRLTDGMGGLEIARDAKKIPALFAHIPFYTLQVHEDNMRWCHMVGSDTVWFKRYGVKQDYNKKTGEEMSSFNRDESAHELLLIQNYTSLSSYYGIPEIISAIGAIMGNKYESDYNLQFFQNNAIPRYVIIVRGGRLDNILKKKIKDYFTREIKKNAHATLFMELPSTDINLPKVEVEFKELDVHEKDSSFRLYRKNMIEEVLVANGVPAYKLGLAVMGSLGGNLGKELIDNYVNSEIEPLQTEVEDLLYMMTSEFAPNYKIIFNDLDIKNEEKLAEINTGYVNGTIMSINEARESIGLANVGSEGDRLLIFTPAGAIEVANVPIKKNGKQVNRKYEDKMKEFKEELDGYYTVGSNGVRHPIS